MWHLASLPFPPPPPPPPPSPISVFVSPCHRHHRRHHLSSSVFSLELMGSSPLQSHKGLPPNLRVDRQTETINHQVYTFLLLELCKGSIRSGTTKETVQKEKFCKKRSEIVQLKRLTTWQPGGLRSLSQIRHFSCQIETTLVNEWMYGWANVMKWAAIKPLFGTEGGHW
jgi:hypothetical protein